MFEWGCIEGTYENTNVEYEALSAMVATYESLIQGTFSSRSFRCMSYRIVLHEHLEVMGIVNRTDDMLNPRPVIGYSRG